MKLSFDELQEILRVLHKRRSLFSKSLRIKKIEALKKIGETENPFNIIIIYRYIFDNNSDISKKSAEVVCQLMKKVKAIEWTQLYPSFHNIELSKTKVNFLTEFPEEISTELLGIASMNGNGYVREEALKQLGELRNERVLPYIILRLSDWVPQIRTLAMNIIHELLDTGFAEYLIQYYYLVDWLLMVRRVDLSSIYNEIFDILRSERNRPKILVHLNNEDPNIRLFCYRIINQAILNDSALLEKALNDRSPYIRWWITKEVIKNESLKNKWLQTLLKDNSPRIRTQVLMAVTDNLWSLYEQDILNCIFDNSPAVRDTARFLLRKKGIIDFADKYRQKILQSGEIHLGWISGLAETGNQEDFRIIEKYVDNNHAKIRASVIAGMWRLDKIRGRDYAIKALEDKSARVRRASVTLLKDTYDSSIRDQIHRILIQGSKRSRVSALHVLSEKGCWESLAAILIVLANTQGDPTNIDWDLLYIWYKRWYAVSWTKPSEEITVIIGRQLAKLKNIKPPEKLKKEWYDLLRLCKEQKL